MLYNYSRGFCYHAVPAFDDGNENMGLQAAAHVSALWFAATKSKMAVMYSQRYFNVRNQTLSLLFPFRVLQYITSVYMKKLASIFPRPSDKYPHQVGWRE